MSGNQKVSEQQGTLGPNKVHDANPAKMKVYRMPKGILIMLSLLGLLPIVGMPLLFNYLPGAEPPPEIAGYFYPFLYGFLFVFGALIFVRMLYYTKKKFVIAEDKIYTEGLFEKRKELMLDEIKGFWPYNESIIDMHPGLIGITSRVRKRNIVVEPKNKEKKTIKIPKYMGKKNEILAWLEGHCQNLETLHWIAKNKKPDKY